MDKLAQQTAKEALHLYLEITIRDEMITNLENKVSMKEGPQLAKAINARIQKEVTEVAQEKFAVILKQVSVIMQEILQKREQL